MNVTTETHEYGGNLASKNVKYLNGIGKVKREDALGANNIWDTVETKYTNVGQVWKQSQPYRANDTVYWTENGYNYVGNDPINRTDPSGLFWGFFKKLLRVILLVAIVVALVIIGLKSGTLHPILQVIKGVFTKLLGKLATGVMWAIAGTIGFKLATEAVTGIKQLANRCNAPNYEELSASRQQELAERGVNPEQWNKLKNNQRLGYFNIVAAFAAAGLSLAGWLVDWTKGGVQQDRTFFKAGAGATNLFSQVSSTNRFAPSNGHEPDYPIGFRFNSNIRSLQLSFANNGLSIDADIDFFNPTNNPFALAGHIGEVFLHSLGDFLGGGNKTSPYSVAYRSSWECKGR